MAGEIVLPQTNLVKDNDTGLQFARTPYCVAFQAGWFKFVLTTVHVFYGDNTAVNPRRLAEIEKIAAFLAKRANNEDANYILLGDFNIFTTNDETFATLEKKGFYVPENIRSAPSNLGKTKHFDQIAFKLKIDAKMQVFAKNAQSGKAGAFDFSKYIYQESEYETYVQSFPENQRVNKTEKQKQTYFKNTWRTHQISDHLPLWVELQIDFSDAYLQRLLG